MAVSRETPSLPESTAWNLLLEAAAGEVVGALRRAGQRSVLFKGPTTARWLYKEDPCVYADVDVLVDPARFEECEGVLEGLGFQRSRMELGFAKGRPGHASTWVRASVTIDLHRRLAGLGAPDEKVWAVLTAQAETWTVGGAEVEVLKPAARCLALALHAAQHGPAFARTADDLERAIAQVPQPLWTEAALLARSLDGEAAMAAGLHSVEAGRHLADLLDLRLERAVPRAGSTSFHVAQGLLWLGRRRGIRSKAQYVLTKLFPPPSLIRSRFPWARSGRVALALAYCVRLGQALAAAPRAVWGLAQLHRERRG
jgi:hypothetical protein